MPLHNFKYSNSSNLKNSYYKSDSLPLPFTCKLCKELIEYHYHVDSYFKSYDWHKSYFLRCMLWTRFIIRLILAFMLLAISWCCEASILCHFLKKFEWHSSIVHLQKSRYSIYSNFKKFLLKDWFSASASSSWVSCLCHIIALQEKMYPESQLISYGNDSFPKGFDTRLHKNNIECQLLTYI